VRLLLSSVSSSMDIAGLQDKAPDAHHYEAAKGWPMRVVV
jgi:hypothetical protein